MRPSRLRPQTDTSPAQWIVDGIGEFGSGIGGLLPRGLEAYVRIPNSGDRAGEHELAELRPERLSELCDVLAGHTTTPERCWFCLWEGWGWIGGSPSVALLRASRTAPVPADPVEIPPAFPPEILNGPRVSLPGREYFLFEGPLDAAGELGWRSGELLTTAYPESGFDADEFWPQSPSLFWPDDRAWCVATEIDLDWTCVGGSVRLAEELLGDPRFQARSVALDDPV
jgi:hypothetical protein